MGIWLGKASYRRGNVDEECHNFGTLSLMKVTRRRFARVTRKRHQETLNEQAFVNSVLLYCYTYVLVLFYKDADGIVRRFHALKT